MSTATAVPLAAQPSAPADVVPVHVQSYAPLEAPAGEKRRSLHHPTDAAAREPGFALAVLALLLQRHSGQAEFDVGVVMSGASHRVRVAVTPEAPFADLQAQVELASSGARQAAPPAEASGCNVVLAVGEVSLDASAQLILGIDAAGISLQYDERVFAAEWAQEFLDQWVFVARQAQHAPQQPIEHVSLLTPAAAARLADPGATIPVPSHAPLHETVMGWAALTPDAPAVAYDDRVYSHAELAALVRKLEAALRAGGAAPGDVVAVSGVRSFGLVAAMLAVLGIGGVLLTLDPKLPAQRRRAMLEQGEARWRVQVGRAGDDVGAEVTTIHCRPDGTFDPEPTGSSATDVGAASAIELRGDAPAYVFFTSGSTGTPKAVLGRHAGLAHFLHWQRTTFGIGPGDRGSQITALSFDVVLRDTFVVLSAGGTLCIPQEADVLDPGRILQWLEDNSVTTVHIVPSLARLWLDMVPKGVRLPRLRRVFFAGEPLTDTLVQRWREAFGHHCDVVNLYGPTETTLAKCWYRVPAVPAPGVQPIGQPLPQTQVLILDRNLRPCGLNEPGQIAIRTPFRTAGYVRNDAANAAAFRRNPATDDPQDLIYLTGDSGRWRTDGLLEIRGRIDNQVKIRGVRIEPAEIEACLARHPAVASVVVTARADARGEKYLVAYFVQRSDATDDGHPEQVHLDALRAFLRDRLPEPMVPAAFVRLDRLPLNANGKVDKRALPAPDLVQHRKGEYVAPETELQRVVARVWADLLGVERVGVDDNFFDIGGHSLLAVQAVRAVERQTGHACSLPDLFTAPTVRALSALLPTARSARVAPMVIPLRSEGNDTTVFCICGIHLYQELADQLAPRMPVVGIFLPWEEALYRPDSSLATTPSVEEMATEYLIALRAVQPRGPYRLVGVSFGGVLAFEIAQQLLASGEHVECLAMLDSMLPRALRRNWVRWALEHAARARRVGWRSMAARIAHRFKRSAGSDRGEASTDENARLEEIRQAIYREATARYSPRPYAGAALLVRATDPGFFKSDIADRSYGWGRLVSDLRFADVNGDHLSILRTPNVQSLAGAVMAEIGRAEPARDGAPAAVRPVAQAAS